MMHVASDLRAEEASKGIGSPWKLTLLTFMFILALVSVANAAPKHPFLENFGSANEPSFTNATGLAVDQSTGDVLVIDSTDKTLTRWHADGTPSNFSALGSNVIDGQGAGDGTPQSGILGETTGAKEVQVAVDNSGGATDGNIYITDSSHGAIDIFGSDGSYLGQLTAAGSTTFGEACGVTVDPAGAVYVAEYSGLIHKFSPSGSVPLNSDNVLSFAATEPCTLAAGAGPTAGYVFVASYEGPVVKFDATTGDEAYVVASGSNTTVSVDPGTGHVYVASGFGINEYDAAGASSASLVSTISGSGSVVGIAVDGSSGKVYADRSAPHIEVFGPLVFGEAPAVTTGNTSAIGNNEATLEGTVDPNEDATTWQFEYGSTTSYGSVAPASPTSAGEGDGAVPVSTSISGLQPGTEYHYRLRATNSSGSSTGDDNTFTTASGALVETTGAPLRTATTVRLEGRVAPMGAATTYHFEYGTAGPCDANPCQSTSSLPAGSGSQYVLVSELVSGLEPGTSYHYRLVADNGNITGQSVGEDMTVATRATNTPPAPAPFPGPPGSDRGWEQVSVEDSNGNPVAGATAISDNGERAIYQVNGGTSETSTGTNFTQALAERTPSGWRSVTTVPARDELVGNISFAPLASSDLSDVILLYAGSAGVTSFRINWGSGFEKLYEPLGSYDNFYEASADGSRLIMQLKGSVDPDHPVGTHPYLYDVTSGSPKMVSLLPGDVVPTCGVSSPQPSIPALPEPFPIRSAGWVAPDGAWVVFPSEGEDCDNRFQLYLRDLNDESTTLVSGPALSGPTCRAEFIKGANDGIFFWTRSRLSSDDNALLTCGEGGGGDVYRYDIGDGSLTCLTCLSHTVDADVPSAERNANSRIAVADDGSRVYFVSPHRLLPGAATPGLYRVDVSGASTRYIAPASDINVGDIAQQGEAINPDGSVLVFRSAAASLNPLNGSDNGLTQQYYRYDDRSRSLTCVSCPQDGEQPIAAAPQSLLSIFDQAGPNETPLDSDGDFVFVTSTPLVPGDENTAGPGQPAVVGSDAYEWRDGRLFLVTDGETQWPGPASAPGISGMTPSGHDVFFTVAGQLTFDAMDGFTRLYDARIGGGFPAPVPSNCPGKACPEAPPVAPARPSDASPGTSSFSGPGNPKPCFRRKKRSHRKPRCHRRHKRRHHSKSRRPQITASWRTSR